ncbi:hypothetical protein CR970_02540 [Candidatus Saccharibacteria bacterium]|nr:MAG: hypothetical protein CR970_02540 [Candidatus Saccharibacteria bacterium]
MAETMGNRLPPPGERLFDVGDNAPAVLPLEASKEDLIICGRALAGAVKVGAIDHDRSSGVFVSSVDHSASMQELRGLVAPWIYMTLADGGSGLDAKEAAACGISSAPEEQQPHLRDFLTSWIRQRLMSDRPELQGALDAMDLIPLTGEREQSELRPLVASLFDRVLTDSESGLREKELVAHNMVLVCEEDRVPLMRKLLIDEELGLDAKEDAVGCLLAYAEGTDVAPLIREALVSDRLDPRVKVAVVGQIPHAPEEDQDELRSLVPPVIREVLADDDLELHSKSDAVRRIVHARQADRTELIREVLGDDKLEPEVRSSAIDLVFRVRRQDQDELRDLIPLVIREALADDTAGWHVKDSAVRQILHAKESDITGLIREVLSDEQLSVYTRIAAAQQIPYAAEADQEGLESLVAPMIRQTFADSEAGLRARWGALYAILNAAQADRTDLIREVLANDNLNPEIKGGAMDLIHSAQKEDRDDLRALVPQIIRQVLADNDVESHVKVVMANRILYAKQADRTDLIREVLTNDRLDPGVKTVAVRQISQVCNPVALTCEVLQDNKLDARVRNAALSWLTRTAENWGSDLPRDHDQRYSLGADKVLVRSPLHDVARAGELVQFEKTGSEAYVLSAEKEATIRVISLQSAIVWLEAVRNWPAWRQAGFNYVPIEPVLGVTQAGHDDKTGEPRVAIMTTNLRGRSYRDARPSFSGFASELDAMKTAILNTLDGLGIRHGHEHDGNFVVVPFTKNGDDVDYRRCPRLYAIDFDASESNTS